MRTDRFGSRRWVSVLPLAVAVGSGVWGMYGTALFLRGSAGFARSAANAEALHLSATLGTVEAGKRANLLLLWEDPGQSIRAYDSIVKVIIGGRVLDRAELAADHDAGTH